MVAKYKFAADSSDHQPKVYLVTAGYYSDYQVCAVFSTQERAVAWVTALNNPDQEPFLIEEYPFDVPFAEWYWWQVDLNIKTGDLEMAKRLDGAALEQPPLPWFSDARIIRAYGRTEEHAIKVAGERRARWLIEHAHE